LDESVGVRVVDRADDFERGVGIVQERTGRARPA
jgi:hypothetical protein